MSGIHVVPTACLRLQMDAVLSDIGADVVKTGMLPDVQARLFSQSIRFAFNSSPFHLKLKIKVGYVAARICCDYGDLRDCWGPRLRLGATAAPLSTVLSARSASNASTF